MKFIVLVIGIICHGMITAAQSVIPDQTFGDNGHVVSNPGKNFNRATSLAIQNDGKVFVAGFSQNNEFDDFGADFVLIKYNEDGSLATDFGTNGMVVTDINNLSSDVATDLVIQNDGKILVAGRTHAGGAYENYGLVVVRYNSDGTLDDTFGSQGKAVIPINSYDDYSYAVSMALQPDGKILLAGSNYVPPFDVFITVRFTAAGIADPSFGNNGIVLTSLGVSFDGNPNAIAIQPDGKILVGGVAIGPVGGTWADFGLVRYEPNGMPDQTFGKNGIVLTPLVDGFNAEWIEDLVVQNDGKIIASGSTSEMNNLNRIAVVRYNIDGTTDNTFGNSGIVLTLLNSSNYFASGVALTNNENIMIAAFTEDGICDFTLTQFQPDGLQDSTFGDHGIVSTNMNEFDVLSDVKIQADGKIVVSGFTGNPSHHDFVVLRYIGTMTGDEPIRKGEYVSVFPNPVSDKLHIRIEDYASTRIKILNMLGEQLINSTPVSFENTYDLSGLPDGVFMVIIEKNRKVLHRSKIVKL